MGTNPDSFQALTRRSCTLSFLWGLPTGAGPLPRLSHPGFQDTICREKSSFPFTPIAGALPEILPETSPICVPKQMSDWHVHRAKSGGGQLLICTAGEGWYQEEGKAAVSLTPGKVITIPANVKHWHGAKKDSWFSHIAVEVPGEETANEWLEAVSSEEYEKLD